MHDEPQMIWERVKPELRYGYGGSGDNPIVDWWSNQARLDRIMDHDALMCERARVLQSRVEANDMTQDLITGGIVLLGTIGVVAVARFVRQCMRTDFLK